MGVWSERVVPRLTDRMLDTDEVGRLRDAACRGLHGRVLEIGFGSGLNLPHLPAAVSELGAVEPADVGWALSERAPRERAAAGAAPRPGRPAPGRGGRSRTTPC